VEGGRGTNGQVILVGTELFRFPRVWGGLGIQLVVAEHVFELGVVGRAVDGGVEIFLRWGEGCSGEWRGIRGGTGWGRGAK